MEIVELEPLAGRELECDHRHSGVVRGEDVRAMLRIAPCDSLALHADRTPPGVEGNTAARVGEISAVIGFFVLHTWDIIQRRCTHKIGQLSAPYLRPSEMDFRVVHSLSTPTVIADRTPDRQVLCDIHLDIDSEPTMLEQSVFIGVEVHT